ncbi:hypothetical protein V6C31_09610 [Caldibacillus debilis]|uniref:hypothetical protein n=1 Tax=Caldibacillus debilis TaxID=301148 RepID=UPI000B571ACC|nr:hypothetical protein [Caldibacillus debilis]OUM90288.1 MAG: hypothetical protein BAA03_00795 [Caldibacillus debilis]
MVGIGIIPGYYEEVGLIVGCGPLADRNRADGGPLREKEPGSDLPFPEILQKLGMAAPEQGGRIPAIRNGMSRVTERKEYLFCLA